MHFDAIVHAPTLRPGARINIAAADQKPNVAPAGLSLGAELWLRFGVCCPDLARGTITELRALPSQTLVLTVGPGSWTLQRGAGGISDPGLHSETWLVAPFEPAD